MPQRIQCTTDGSPIEGVYVGPDSEWACPITFSDVGGQYPSLTIPQIARMIVRDFEVLARRGRLAFPSWRFLGGERGPVEFTYPSVERIRSELAGRDLVCWCEPEIACHADVLLELANGGAS
ncbi:DUF4326 domain-containing protein [Gordonia sp. SCSIO 19800]|uniref:DUF4326 domain-containing protein n=1 Tax=Gordonia sp. SCSIO 19800 TaxID=2826926 RepID=UPI001B81B788|nr:DUF4326 domain-containing protein [Gordonia sp. SCSIO 19800]MBR7191699.1 DUF4326 domain-containing protein [Gordonia sp. SCSIO 19800]